MLRGKFLLILRRGFLLGPPARGVGLLWRKITSTRSAVRKRNNEIKWPKVTGKSCRFHSHSVQEHLHRECSICSLKRHHSTEIILQLFPQKKNIFSLPIFFDSILIVLVLSESRVKVKSASEVKLLKWKSSVI